MPAYVKRQCHGGAECAEGTANVRNRNGKYRQHDYRKNNNKPFDSVALHITDNTYILQSGTGYYLGANDVKKTGMSAPGTGLL